MRNHVILFTALVMLLPGCGRSGSPPAPAGEGVPAAEEGEAAGGHGTGPHQGQVADFGKYHLELAIDRGKHEATVYVLGSDAKTPAPVVAADGLLMLISDNPPLEIDLKAVPNDGESDGASSRYVGQDEGLGSVETFVGTISGDLDGNPFTAQF